MAAGSGSTRSTDCIVTWRRQRRRLQKNLQRTSCGALAALTDTELEQRLGRLCNDLMDYLATGHGFVYTRYCHPGTGAGGACNPALREIWQHLGRTTDAALRFNRRCETTPPATLQERLPLELARLNRTLSLRFALEEQLLELGGQARAVAGVKHQGLREPVALYVRG